VSVGESRVGIVGGSVAGCAMAVAAGRLGCDVSVFEASRGDLEDRGAGIFIPLGLREALVAKGYLSADTPYCHPTERLWITADPADPAGRVLWRHAFPGAAHNWGVLWRVLRSLVPDSAYHKGTAVRGCTGDAGGVTLVLDDGTTERCDVVIGADGYSSTVRRAVCPDVRPGYAGYVLWRGNYEEHLIAGSEAAAVLETGFPTICFPGGHAIVYLIPGRNGGTGPGERRVNWGVYGSPSTDMDFGEATSIPPGQVPGALTNRLDQILDDHLPPAWAAVIRAGGPEVLSVQPIYDHAAPIFVRDRIILAGDAAALSRPHTASGVVKAMEEAIAFEAAGSTAETWPEVLAAFQSGRCPAGNEIVELSRLLGHGLVDHPPDWATMTSEEVALFVTSLTSGRTLYMQPPRSESVVGH